MVKRTTGKSVADGRHELSKQPRHTTNSSEKAKLSSDDIISLFKTHDAGLLRQGLITLQSQLYFDLEDTSIDPQDERLVLAKSWLEQSPSAEGLLETLQGSEKNPGVTQLCFSILASLLGLLSTHFMYHPYGAAVLKAVLLPQNLDVLNSNISDGPQDVISSALSLFNAMSSFAGGVEKRAVMDGFTWGQKTRQKLFFLRRKIKSPAEDVTSRPDIRTLYIKFILSFLGKSTPTLIKVAFLDQHKDIFLSIFKGMDQDPYHVVRYILETCWEGIWNDNKLRRTTKIALFQERTLAHLLKLYDRNNPEGDDEEHVPANVIHHFLLAIMTRPGFGVCFRDRGWYTKDEDESTSFNTEHQEDDPTERPRGKMYNKILFNVLKLLKANEDHRQQELTFKILQACPELVNGYWTSVNLTLEPRLSSRWVTNISILGHIISFPIPVESFTLATSGHIDSVAPPLRSCISNILPTVLNRTYLSKGLQSTSTLVKHCTALALIKCLMKLSRVMTVFQKNSSMLEEEETSGQWAGRARDLQREVERRVPDVMVIISMAQQSQKTNDASSVLLGECALRLLVLYQTLFPRLFFEVKFDTGKLLENALEFSQTDVPSHHSVLYQFHILRYLTKDDLFSGLNKMDSVHSQLYGIFLLHAKSESLVIRDAAATLSNKILSSSILFMHDPAELDLWLQAISRTRANSDTKSLNEVTAVLGFLDDCIQRCSKTPYKYLEELPPFFKRENTYDLDFTVLPSPLLITVLEQFEAKIGAELLNPFETLALTTYIRKLGVGLSTKFLSLDDARIIQNKLAELVSKPIIPAGTVNFHAALQWECTLFSSIVDFIENPSCKPFPVGESSMKHTPPVFNSSDPCHRAYEILDWLRFHLSTLSNEDIGRFFNTIFELHPPACAEFCYYIDPTTGVFYNNIHMSEMLPFEFCDVCLNIDGMPAEHLSRLIACFYSGRSWNRSFIRKLAITLHRLRFRSSDDLVGRSSRVSLLNFIGQIIAYGVERNIVDVNAVSEALFVVSDCMRDLCCSTTLTEAETRALHDLVQITVDLTSQDSRETIKSYSIFWADLVKDTKDLATCLKASPWIMSMDPEALVQFLDLVLQSGRNHIDDYVVESLLSGLARQLDNGYVVEQLQSRIEGLLYLPCQDIVNRLILAVLEATLPIGYKGPIAHLDSTIPTTSLLTMAEQSRKKWLQKGEDKQDPKSFDFHFSKLLEDIDRNGAAISACFYKYGNTRSLFKNWLRQNSPPLLLSHGHIVCLHGFLDSISFQKDFDLEVLQSWSKSLIDFAFYQSGSHRLRSLCAESITFLIKNPAYRSFYAAWLGENAQLVGHRSINPEAIQIVTALKTPGDEVIGKSLRTFLEPILEWIGRQFASEELIEPTKDLISLLIPIFQGHKFTPSQVETVVKFAIRNHLNLPSVLDISTVLIQSTDFKPMIINQLLQSVLQHSRLYTVANGDSLTKLLYTLFNQYPINTCQPSHVIPLLRLYRGTMSRSDRRLLSVFQLYERQTRQSIASLFCHWSASQLPTPSQNILTAVMTLDSNKVFRTSYSYPKTRELNGLVDESSFNEELYDPIFLVSMASQIILANDHVSVPDWVQIFRTNIFSVTVSALSSKDNNMRQISLAILAGLYRRLQNALLIEKDQVLYILDILKNTLSREDIVPRLPTFVVSFLAYALRSIFYPSSFLYPVMSRFLLQRPEFDVTDVPLLYSLLFSASDSDWAKERAWIIRYLTQIMDDGELAEWKILRRRHTWDLIASMWQASKLNERSFRKSILEFMANMTANQYALPSLVLRSQILFWVEMELADGVSIATELLAWLKIIENIVVFMDFRRAEKALDGIYSDSIIRCLKRISHTLQLGAIESCSLSLKLSLVYLASRILLRTSEMELTYFGHVRIMEVAEILSEVLFSLESSLQWSTNDVGSLHQNVSDAHFVSLPPHKAGSLVVSDSGETSPHANNCKGWAYIVIFLWRIIMTSTNLRHVLWDHLTHRCLMIHSLMIIASDSPEGVVLNWIRTRVLELIVQDG